MNNAIETKGLTKRFGKTVAVNGLDLAVPAGSIFAFLGPNGAGKTTTIKTLMNIPFFALIGEKQIISSNLHFEFRRLELNRGETLFVEGEKNNDKFYIVQKGVIQVFSQAEHRSKRK